MRSGLLVVLLVGVLAGTPLALGAQAVSSVPFRILDEERLLRDSRLGAEILAQIRTAEQALDQENERISEQLAAEERDLTEARATLAPEAFRARADAFDQRVEEIRAERARLSAELNRQSESEAQRFYEIALPVLIALMEERGLAAILKPEAVILGVDWLDMTDDAIARLNAATHPPAP